MKDLLQKSWLSRGWLASTLWPVAQIYGLIASARLQLYRLGIFKSERFPVAVIVVGNVGAFSLTPPDAGTYLALIRHRIAAPFGAATPYRSYSYTLTFEATE